MQWEIVNSSFCIGNASYYNYYYYYLLFLFFFAILLLGSQSVIFREFTEVQRSVSSKTTRVE